MGLSGDLRTDGFSPEVDQMPIHGSVRNIPFLKDLMEDFP